MFFTLYFLIYQKISNMEWTLLWWYHPKPWEITTSQTRWMKFLLLSCQSLYKFWCHFRVQVKFESHCFTVLDHIILMFLIIPPQYSIIFSGKNVGLLLWKIWKAWYKTKDWYSLAERKSYCIFSHDSISYLKNFCTNGWGEVK